jgi:hypothetical protein
MTTLKKSPEKSYVNNTSIAEDDLDVNYSIGFSNKSPFVDDEDEFDLPLDDLDTLETFDSDDDDDY